MLHGLKILAFMAMAFTFSNYNLDLEQVGELLSQAAEGKFVRMITVLYEQYDLQPFLSTSLFGWEGGSDVLDESSVTLSNGSVIKGSVTPLATVYRNIRYAQPPVGNLRFSDPVPYEQPSFVDATSQRRWICPQKCDSKMCQGEVSEDCLYLNINVPSTYNGNNGKLPVMVWIHGGGFTEGGANEPLYDMAGFSNLTGTIVVSMNYRLGWLGFLPYEKGGIDGNQGLKDQRMAMKWVHDNIEAFGGDNTQITLFGESAGSQSALYHVLSKESSPYYQRAILQSTYAYPYQTKREWTEIADILLTQFKLRFKCNMLMDAMECFRDIPYEEFLKLTDFSSNTARALFGARAHYVPLALPSNLHIYMETNTPWYDNNPLELLERGEWNSDKDIIIGHTDGENDNFDYAQVDKQQLQDVAGVIYGENIGTAAVALYESQMQNPDYGVIAGDLMTDADYACYAKTIARKMSETGSGKLYFYEFAQPWQVTDFETGQLVLKKAQHAGELSYLFRNQFPFLESYAGTDGDLQVMEMLTDYWGSFARGASPESNKYSSWPEYQASGSMNILKISQPNSTIISGAMDENKCQFWEASGFWKRS